MKKPKRKAVITKVINADCVEIKFEHSAGRPKVVCSGSSDWRKKGTRGWVKWVNAGNVQFWGFEPFMYDCK